MCIADVIDLKAFRDFFVQLDLPLKATRFEQFDVKATILNYGFYNKTVSMTLYLRTMQQLAVENVYEFEFIVNCFEKYVTVSCLIN
jgi:hypothetical protein